MLFENVPYTNFHDMNLDWVIKVVKDFLNKYNHIQELIDTGINDIQQKTEEMQALLDEWYETHSDQLARQLAHALDDLNRQYNLNVTEFIQQADAKAAETIASIPADYSTLAKEVANLKNVNAFNITPEKTGSTTHRGITFDWNTSGGCYIHGTNDGSAASSDNIYYNEHAMAPGFSVGGTYYRKFIGPSYLRLQILGFNSSGTLSVLDDGIPGSNSFTIPSGIVGMAIRILVVLGSTANTTVYPIISTGLSNQDLSYQQINLQPIVEEIQKDVSDLKLHELSMNFGNATNLNSATFWEQGSISPTTGEDVASGSRIRTKTYIPTNVAIMRLPNTNRGFFICGYDNNENFLGVYESSGEWVINGGNGYTEFNFGEIYSVYNNVNLRVYLYSKDGTDISMDEADDIIFLSIYNQLINPVKIRVMQYNIGRFNFGHDGGYSGADIGLKLSNYRAFMYKYHPDILTLQEYREFVDAENQMNAKNIIFSPVKPYDSYEEHGYIIYGNYSMPGFRHTYLHTSGDFPARMVYGPIVVNNSEIGLATAALNTQGGSPDAAMKKRALTKMFELLSRYETAIVGLDTNVSSQEEAETVKAFLKANGYTPANWDYSLYLDTYNPNSTEYKKIDNIFIKGKAAFQNVFTMDPSKYNDLLSDHIPIIADILIYK